MNLQLAIGIALPFFGTALGAAVVFLVKGEMPVILQKAFLGFAAGIMVAACFWSLLAPALEESAHWGKLAFVPPALGFLTGALFLLLLDKVTPHMHGSNQEEGPKTHLPATTKLILAITLHNIPEGMAVGVVFAGWLEGEGAVSLTAAFILAAGIAAQNIPEGAVVSTPLLAAGMPKGRTFLWGVFTGAVEPVASILTILAAGVVVPLLPFLLAFAAGAMMYVVVEDLIVEMSKGEHTNVGTLMFSLGFVLMMILDVTLG